MRLFNVYAPGVDVMLLTGDSRAAVQQSVFDYVKAFYPRRKWELKFITVVEVGV